MDSKKSISFWQNSITRRYFLLSLLIAIVPLAMTTWFYDRFAGQLIQDLETQQINASLDQVNRSIDGFIRSREFRLKAVVDLPRVEQFLTTTDSSELPDRILSLVNYEIDSADIYGVFFFDRFWQLRHALPGQSAAGFPYWGEGHFDISHLTKVPKNDFLLIGPTPPSTGNSGWFLLALPLNSPEPGMPSPGYAAFQIRLASLTKTLGTLNNMAGLSGYLDTPSDYRFDQLGTLQATRKAAVISKEFLPDWTISLTQDIETPNFRDQIERPMFLAGVGATLILVLTFFAILIFRIRHRITPLIDGADAISRGDWSQRIAPTGNDEFTQLAQSFNQMAEHLNGLLDHRIEMEKKATWGEFSTAIAHEIRNPLATMKVCVQSLAPAVKGDQPQEMLTLVLEEIDRINHLIQNLLNYARPVEPEWSVINSTDMLQRIYNLAFPLAKERGIHLELSTENSCNLTVDEGQLQQILMNLVLNALEAIEDHGSLNIISHCDNDQAIIEISDTGIGMTTDQLNKATQPFFTTKMDGSGLGLAISARLVQLNGGTLNIASQLNEGTTVTLTFDSGAKAHD